MAKIELSDMIVGLRKELQEAQAKAETEDLKFNVESIDVEAQVTASAEADAQGRLKWKFWVFSEAEGSVGAKVAKETLQTIRLKLTPQGSLQVSGMAGKPVR